MLETDESAIPATMKAWVYDSVKGGIEKNLKLVTDRPLPLSLRQLPKDSILVRVLAVSANPVDHKLPELPVVGGLVIRRPATPCADFSGRVVAATAPGFEPGQLVAGKVTDIQRFGALAEYTLATPKDCVVVPEGVSPEQAACASIAGTTAWKMLAPHIKPLLAARQASDSSDSPLRVFINGGSGGVGSFAIQIAKSFGCHVTTSCSAGNADFVRQLGADDVIDYRTTNVPETLAAKVASPGGQSLFDLALDTIGAPFAYYKAADKYLDPKGTYVQVSVTKVSDLLWINLLPSFLGGGKRKTVFTMTGSNAVPLRQVLDLIAAGKVKEPVEVLPFEEAPKAFEKLRTHRTRGKIVIKVAEDK